MITTKCKNCGQPFTQGGSVRGNESGMWHDVCPTSPTNTRISEILEELLDDLGLKEWWPKHLGAIKADESLSQLLADEVSRAKKDELRLTIDMVWGHMGRHNRDDPPKELLDRLSELERKESKHLDYFGVGDLAHKESAQDLLNQIHLDEQAKKESKDE